ncbi:MAG: SAM-dependent methyltransferase, partial [Proteobacteria bacterium]|nr:SAM-dependent methyltransferase [Pseudomonadota bacterium]
EHAHRWLGFDDAALHDMLEAGGLVAETPVRVESGPMTVMLWLGRRPANDVRAPDPALQVG